MELKFFNPFEEIRRTRHNLPHWQQPGATYFITFRLADSIPAHLLEAWTQERDAWLARHPPPLTPAQEAEYHERFSGQMDRWLDHGHGSCVLRDAESRELVKESLRHFEGVRYHHFSWVIMPNHVHLLTTLQAEWTLEKVIFTWKRHTSGAINTKHARRGQLWQHDYFDRLIRDAQHFENVVRYIRRNPVKTELREFEFTLFESDFVKEFVP